MKVNIGRYVNDAKKRKISIHIDDYDTWSADNTIAMIIVPLLLQLKKTKHGSPNVSDDDVPVHLRSDKAAAKENEWDFDSNGHLRWDYVMDEMIYAMQEIANGKEGADIFYDNSNVDENSDIMQQVKAMKCDHCGLKAYEERVQKGCELFGKYFQGLWD